VSILTIEGYGVTQTRVQKDDIEMIRIRETSHLRSRSAGSSRSTTTATSSSSCTIKDARSD
jgi:hypothetical protein